jgi:hypothetical protein
VVTTVRTKSIPTLSNIAGTSPTLSAPANDHTWITTLSALVGHDKMLAKWPSPRDGSGTDAHAITGDPTTAPKRIPCRRHTTNSSTRSNRQRGKHLRSTSSVTTVSNQDATLFYSLQDVPPREEPFLKAPTPKDPFGQIFKAPKENTPLMAPKRKLQFRRPPLILIPNSFSETARSPTPLLPPLLLRLVLRRRTQRQERRVLPGYDSVSCRFLPSLQRQLSVERDQICLLK